jgi:hypothetical protein
VKRWAHCQRCRRNPAHLCSYWGQHLCRPCARALPPLFDRNDTWPPFPEPIAA